MIVQLELAHVHLAAEPATYVSFRPSEISVNPSRTMEILALANNRRVAVAFPDSRIGYSIGFRFIDRTAVDTIALWVLQGRTIVIRDNRGNKVFGVVPSINIEEVPFRDDIVSGGFNVEEIYFSEVV